ncbi:DUF58 domain-containing protein [Agarivorans sp. B2Z047]|uniref:DUF58 domain-containing protein n=1 Tax=Agarivorans sp. B2Z047 TaxID=2652721 RepID=UPI00128D8571|nr:DUF58 domain-containing protein [Agarivorans sp. B2Z047]MPW28630.1 DUF58 domain-containing protein [Agarivorans sp. B2Z047]UQN41191.1 DUF58 domain-containing protein [Agarivorans sp. B2Z047]
MDTISRQSPVSLQIEQLIEARAIHLNMPPWRQVSSSRHGNRLSKVRGRGMEFDEVRHYQPGDDIRCIDWRVTARTGKTHTKLFREDREHPVFIFLDLSHSMYFGSGDKLKSVFASELAACLGWNAQQLGERVALTLHLGEQAHNQKPAASKTHWLAQLQSIVDVHNQQFAALSEQQLQDSSPTHNLETLCQLVKTGYQVHLISDFYHFDKAASLHLQRLASHNQVFAWQISDPLEQQLPKAHTAMQLQVSNGNSEGYLQPDNKAFRQQFKRLANLRQQQIEQMLQQARIPHQHFSTALEWQDYA